MTRRTSRRSPKPPPSPGAKAVVTHRRGKPTQPLQPTNPVPTDLKASIIANWELPSDNINTCVTSERWPYNEPDPEKWHIDIVRLLHEASALSKGNNKAFQLDLDREIHLRQLKDKSAKGKAGYMTAADVKRACKRLESRQDGKEETDEMREEIEAAVKPARRGRSSGKPAAEIQAGDARAAEIKDNSQAQKAIASHGRGKPKRKESDKQDLIELGTKRQASDLPIRPARKLRGGRSPKTEQPKPRKAVDSPPITPANPLENSDAEEEDQENEPPEPVSGRHIYGDVIKPTTIDFNPSGEPTAQARTRQTRKRGRAESDKPPTEVQIDSDPRDIDATGFLSELDPKEARRRRKPRLSRLQQDRVTVPPWSQDIPAPLGTPLLTPTAKTLVSVTPALPPSADVAAMSSPAARPTNASRDDELGIEILLDLLPCIPDTATPEQRSMLEDRVALIHRDVVAYKTAVGEIIARTVN
ncbi:hypothetical protein EJ07DRAFT_183877 [Lizonia empirigonia]|nr:hypothetical protein EJ07DRAFT_183877 [Lizonia empirigonia]